MDVVPLIGSAIVMVHVVAESDDVGRAMCTGEDNYSMECKGRNCSQGRGRWERERDRERWERERERVKETGRGERG